MTLIAGAVPYSATATTRLQWQELPTPVQSWIGAALGSPVATARSAGGGFTGGFASTVTTADGDSFFVKAESRVRNPVVADNYAREAVVNAVLPSQLSAPRLLHHGEPDGWVVLCFEAIDGHMPEWSTPTDVDAVLALAEQTAELLAEPPTRLKMVTMAEACPGALEQWRDQAAGKTALVDLSRWPSLTLDRLVELEEQALSAIAGNAMLHFDLRLDNIVIDRTGRPWLCDWNWPCLGAAWVDLVVMLAPALVAGIDVEAVIAGHPVSRDIDPNAIDSVLAALAGLFLVSSTYSDRELASPWLRTHQRFSGAACLDWLAVRTQR